MLSSPDPTAQPSNRELCWIITEGAVGMENQALGLAEAIGLPIVVKRVTARAPWKNLPAQIWLRPLNVVTAQSDPLVPPWPRLLISCGRRSVPFSTAIRRASAGTCFTVHIQSPKTRLHHFDLIVPPRHDGLAGPNVISSRGALNRITPTKLAEGARRLRPRLEHLPRPLVAVLLGGTSNSYRLTTARTSHIADQLLNLMQSTGAALAITPSRRTGQENVAELRRKLPEDGVFFWDGTGTNPYFGLLGLADTIVVTCDSASMVSEAASTGKPVYVIDLDGGSRRFRLFHDMLREDGITRCFDGRLEQWSYAPLDDTETVAATVRQRIGLPPQEPNRCR
jgi:mitochondrial fission protein ELM1